MSSDMCQVQVHQVHQMQVHQVHQVQVHKVHQVHQVQVHREAHGDYLPSPGGAPEEALVLGGAGAAQAAEARTHVS